MCKFRYFICRFTEVDVGHGNNVKYISSNHMKCVHKPPLITIALLYLLVNTGDPNKSQAFNFDYNAI